MPRRLLAQYHELPVSINKRVADWEQGVWPDDAVDEIDAGPGYKTFLIQTGPGNSARRRFLRSCASRWFGALDHRDTTYSRRGVCRQRVQTRTTFRSGSTATTARSHDAALATDDDGKRATLTDELQERGPPPGIRTSSTLGRLHIACWKLGPPGGN